MREADTVAQRLDEPQLQPAPGGQTQLALDVDRQVPLPGRAHSLIVAMLL